MTTKDLIQAKISKIQDLKSTPITRKTPAEVMDNIIKALDDSEKTITLLVDTIEEVLQTMRRDLIGKDGKFLKVGLFNWKNIGKYTSFAEYFKNKVIELNAELLDNKDTENTTD